MNIAKYIVTALFCGFVALGAGCASKHPDEIQKGTTSAMEPYGTYALDGPDLFVVGDLAGTPLQGTLQRKAMVGIGRLHLYSPDKALICESAIKARPTDKGRVRGLLDCNDGNIVLFSLRNLGPDQGLGIGTSREGGKYLTIFYHPSPEEAQRRFPKILEEFSALRQEKRP